jgi:ABC-type nitrate/sulfonate/bicarbonate transport system substrate-binding protein
MRRCCFIVAFLFSLGAEQSLDAQARHLYGSAAVSGMHLPVWTAKDLGLFQKYGWSVDVVVISGGTIGMQSLLGGSTQTSSSAAMGPINSVLAGGDAVIIGGVLNKNLLKFVARKEIREVDPEWLSPQAPNLVSQHKVVVGLLAACRHGQHQVADPEGNFLDVSE